MMQPMTSPQNDYIVSPETNHPPLLVQPNTADHSSLSNNASPGQHSPASFQNLDLEYFSDYPLSTVDKFTELMGMCLKENNPEAHYVEGLKEYFYFHNTSKGLNHLRRAANGNNDNSMYMYGLLMMCRGNIDEGKQYLAALGWEDNKTCVDHCWRRIRRSLRYLDIVMKRRYVRNMLLLKPSKRCHVNDMDNRCKRCFHCKQVMKFIDFI